ncbi:hypothetical protein ACWFQ8_33325 [Streptomyces sp. NPDC055254]
MSDVTLTPEEEDRLQRLRAMLRGSGTASENKYLLGLRQGRKGGVLIGMMLHAAERYRQGLALTDLEQSLLRLWQGMFSDQEIRASGQEYRSAVEGLGTLDIISNKVTERPPSSGFTAADLRALLPEVGQEALGMANVSVASPETLAAGEPIDSAAFQAGLHEVGFATTVFRSPPPDPESVPEVPSYQASLQLEKFYVRRAAGDQGGGKDEIYWTVAATSDKHKAPVYTSQEFGGVKKGQTRDFNAGKKVVFTGPAGRYLVLGITAWEADQSNSEWYDSLYTALDEWLYEMRYTLELAFLLLPEWAGIGFELAKLMVWLMQYLRNHDDESCTRTILLDRHAMITLHHRQTDVWEFDGDGHHALTVKYTGQRPIFPSGTLEYVRLDTGKSAWNASVSLGWKSTAPPALASFGDQLHAVYTRPGDRALMWSRTVDGGWTEPAQIKDFLSDYQPALAVHSSRWQPHKLFLAFVAMDGRIRVCAWTTSEGWSDGVLLPSAITGRGIGMTSGEKLVIAHRDSGGTISVDYSYDGVDWGEGGSAHTPLSSSSTVSCADYGGNMWYAARGGDGQNHVHRRVANSYVEVQLPGTWRTLDPPSMTTHNDEVRLVARSQQGELHGLHGTEQSWTPFPTANVGAMEGECGVTSHNGALYVMYRRPN